MSPFFTLLLHPRAVALGQGSVCPTSRIEPFCLHSNIVTRLSGGARECVLCLPSPFLQPDGCPDLCNGNGRCTLGQNSWQCVCQSGWRGPGCNVAMETACADNKDNEGGEQNSFHSQSLKNRGLYALSSESFSFRKTLAVIVVKRRCHIAFETNETGRAAESCRDMVTPNACSGLTDPVPLHVPLTPMVESMAQRTRTFSFGSWRMGSAEQLAVPVCTSGAADRAGHLAQGCALVYTTCVSGSSHCQTAQLVCQASKG